MNAWTYTVEDVDAERTLLHDATETQALAACRRHRNPAQLHVTAWSAERDGYGLPEIAGHINGEEFADDPASILS